ncbi:MAG: hypothetical protein F6K47_30300 [Symploca sp. SIO2E6]|nr:hypothetical protein [Symploca sp. SIO2E6]
MMLLFQNPLRVKVCGTGIGASSSGGTGIGASSSGGTGIGASSSGGTGILPVVIVELASVPVVVMWNWHLASSSYVELASCQ